ncbi:MAG: hypothetical protein LBM87_07050 [Ruminococcus sp.]|jgi:hypothetical protein|nr:hypothetical protein [Ruminococcus sp.]
MSNFFKILKNQYKNKSTLLLLLAVVIYICVYITGIGSNINKYSGTFIAPLCCLIAAILFPILASVFLCSKDGGILNFKPPVLTFYGFKNAASSLQKLVSTDIHTGDLIFVSKGGYIPQGGTVLDGSADVLEPRPKSGAGFNRTTKYNSKKGGAAAQILPGTIVLSGALKIEITGETPAIPQKRKSKLNILDIVYISCAILTAAVVVIRLIMGGYPNIAMQEFEILADNIALGICTLQCAAVFGQGLNYLTSVFIVSGKIPKVLSPSADVYELGNAENLIADLSFISKTETVSYITPGGAEYLSDELTPDLRELLGEIIENTTQNEFGAVSEAKDDILMREFCPEVTDDETAKYRKILSAIHFSEGKRFRAATVSDGENVITEFIGEAAEFMSCTKKMLPDGKITEMSEADKKEIQLILTKNSSAGKRMRLIMLTPEKIKDNTLPPENRIFIGFICFWEKLSADVKRAAKLLTESGITINIISYENTEFNRFIRKEIGIDGIIGSGVIAVSRPEEISAAASNIGGTVICASDSAENFAAVKLSELEEGLPARNIIQFCGRFAENANRRFSGFEADDLSDLADTIEAGVGFGAAVKICALLLAAVTAVLLLMFGIWLTPIPVPFADNILPATILMSLITSLLSVFVMKKTVQKSE